MPVEIRELVIRATVNASRTPAPAEAQPREREIEDIVSACVEQVLDILRREKER